MLVPMLIHVYIYAHNQTTVLSCKLLKFLQKRYNET